MSSLEKVFRDEIKNSEISTEVKRFHQKDSFKGFQSLFADWLLIVIGVCISYFGSPWFLPLSLIIIGSRQRALSNLIHDGAHYNLFQVKRNLSDMIVNVMAAYPAFESVEGYRKSHAGHHLFLGTTKDPDAKKHHECGYDDISPKKGPFHRVYGSLVLNFISWKQSIGLDLSLKDKSTLKAALWWALVVTGLSLISPLFALYAISLWWGARATTYHLIRVFAEYMDHTGLAMGSTFSFTRNIPGAGPLRHIVHPHFDNYHLVHHLFPAIPHYNLRSAHKLLMKTSFTYRRAHHCDSYIWGKSSAISSWCGENHQAKELPA